MEVQGPDNGNIDNTNNKSSNQIAPRLTNYFLKVKNHLE